jgi:hypothetical protein
LGLRETRQINVGVDNGHCTALILRFWFYAAGYIDLLLEKNIIHLWKNYCLNSFKEHDQRFFSLPFFFLGVPRHHAMHSHLLAVAPWVADEMTLAAAAATATNSFARC